MTTHRSHLLQIRLHVIIFAEQLIPEKTVHGENRRTPGEIPADAAYGLLHGGLVVPQFQQNQHIRIVHLPETRQGISADLFNGNNTGIVSVNLPEGILEGLRQNLLIRHMKDILIHLLCRHPVQRTDHISCPVRVGSDKPVTSILPVDIFFISLNPAVLVPNDSVGRSILINPAVGRHLSAVSRPAYQLDPVLLQYRVNRSQHTGIISAAEINAHRIPVHPAYLRHVLLQAADVLHRHDRHLLQYVCRRFDPIGKRNHRNALFHDSDVVSHPDTPDTGNPGIDCLQRLHMCFKLRVI